ncbi:hypothetical protein ACHAXA_003604 [Cyclostephanos tholiformis]|uniref:Uncharacterized protein n=1 Tax=Cyclostephanos tholiformis TaxID=382380 RepID=A0ABD3SQ93_9STRA
MACHRGRWVRLALLTSLCHRSHHRSSAAYLCNFLPHRRDHRPPPPPPPPRHTPEGGGIAVVPVVIRRRPPTRRGTTSTIRMSTSTSMSYMSEQRRDKISDDRIFFVELGFGNDSHGQSSTKAAVRACRNAIEFNSIPSIRRLIPEGGYDALKLDVLLAIPPKYRDGLDLSEVAKVFPYGDVRFELQDGGMVAPSGIAIERLGDVNDDMVVVCASVTVGH